MSKKEWPANQASMEAQTPTNGHAAKRPYCIKHSRAKLDIGGEKVCTACRDEERAKQAAGGGR